MRTHYFVLGLWAALVFVVAAFFAIKGYLYPPAFCGDWDIFCSTIPRKNANEQGFSIMITGLVLLVPTLILMLLFERRDRRFSVIQELIAVFGPIGTVFLIGFVLLVIFS